MENNNLEKLVNKRESKLKELIVDFVGNSKNPEKDEVTVEMIVETFADQFPEFLLAVAEENWVSGYTQALNDVQFVEKEKARRLQEAKEA